MPLRDLRRQPVAVPAGGKRHEPEAIRMAAKHGERAPADGAGGSEHRHAAHQTSPKSRYIAAASGTTK